MAFSGFSSSGISFGDTNMVLTNLCTIYADISRTVKNMSDDLLIYTEMYKAAIVPAQKIKLGNKLINMACIQGGLMAALINNPAMLQVDISATLKFASECNELISEMEHLLIEVTEEEKFDCTLMIVDSKNIVYQNKLWIYRFIDISSLLGVF